MTEAVSSSNTTSPSQAFRTTPRPIFSPEEYIEYKESRGQQLKILNLIER